MCYNELILSEGILRHSFRWFLLWLNVTGVLIADIVLQLLSYVAQTEREFIRKRQAEGLAAAKARGVRFGRLPLERPTEFSELKIRWSKKEISARSVAKELGITHKTFIRWATEENG